MKKITLGQLLQYFEPFEKIQIMTYGHDWDEAVEVRVGDHLLAPLHDYIVTAMGYEESYKDGSPILRVSVKKGEELWVLIGNVS